VRPPGARGTHSCWPESCWPARKSARCLSVLAQRLSVLACSASQSLRAQLQHMRVEAATCHEPQVVMLPNQAPCRCVLALDEIGATSTKVRALWLCIFSCRDASSEQSIHMQKHFRLSRTLQRVSDQSPLTPIVHAAGRDCSHDQPCPRQRLRRPGDQRHWPVRCGGEPCMLRSQRSAACASAGGGQCGPAPRSALVQRPVRHTKARVTSDKAAS